MVQLPAGSWHGLRRWEHGLCMRCVVSCGSTPFPRPVFFFEALLQWGDMSSVHQIWPNHLAKHSERGKKTGQTEEEVERHQGMDRPGGRQFPEDSGEERKMKGTGCKEICGAPTTFAVKG